MQQMHLKLRWTKSNGGLCAVTEPLGMLRGLSQDLGTWVQVSPPPNLSCPHLLEVIITSVVEKQNMCMCWKGQNTE